MRLAALPSTILSIPEGPAGTLATLQIMGNLVLQFKKNPFIREQAASVIQTVPAKNWPAEMAALLNFVRNNIRYTLDINGVELVQTPIATLTLQRGDCDDMATLLAAMAESVGFPAKFVAIGFDPGMFDHVFVSMQNPDTGQWIDADPTEQNPLGWSTDGYVTRIDYPVGP